MNRGPVAWASVKILVAMKSFRLRSSTKGS